MASNSIDRQREHSVPKSLYDPLKRKINNDFGIPICSDEITRIKGFAPNEKSVINAQRISIRSWKQREALESLKNASDKFLQSNRRKIEDWLQKRNNPEYEREMTWNQYQTELKAINRSAVYNGIRYNGLKAKVDEIEKEIRYWNSQKRVSSESADSIDDNNRKISDLTFTKGGFEQRKERIIQILKDLDADPKKKKNLVEEYGSVEKVKTICEQRIKELNHRIESYDLRISALISKNNQLVSPKDITADRSIDLQIKRRVDERKRIQEVLNKRDSLKNALDSKYSKRHKKRLSADYQADLRSSLNEICVSFGFIRNATYPFIRLADVRPYTLKEREDLEIKRRALTVISKDKSRPLRSSALEAYLGFSWRPGVKNKYDRDVDWFKSHLNKTFAEAPFYKDRAERVIEDAYYYERKTEYHPEAIKVMELIAENASLATMMNIMENGIEKFGVEIKGFSGKNALLSFKNPSKINELLKSNIRSLARNTIYIDYEDIGFNELASIAITVFDTEYQQYSKTLKEIQNLNLETKKFLIQKDFSLLTSHISYYAERKFKRVMSKNLLPYAYSVLNHKGRTEIRSIEGFADFAREHLFKNASHGIDYRLTSKNVFELREKELFWTKEDSHYVKNIGKVSKLQISRAIKSLEKAVEKNRIKEYLKIMLTSKKPLMRYFRIALEHSGVLEQMRIAYDFIRKKDYESERKTNEFLKNRMNTLVQTYDWGDSRRAGFDLSKILEAMRTIYDFASDIQRMRTKTSGLAKFEKTSERLVKADYEVSYYFDGKSRQSKYSRDDIKNNEELFELLVDKNNGYDFLRAYIENIMPYRSGISKQIRIYVSNYMTDNKFSNRSNQERMSRLINEDFVYCMLSGIVPLWYSANSKWTEYKMRYGFSGMKFIMTGEFVKSVRFFVSLVGEDGLYRI